MTRRTTFRWTTRPPDTQPPTHSGPSAPSDGLSAEVAGRYELISPLGSGGGGEVWRARDRYTGDYRAIKLIQTRNDTQLAAVRREVTALRWLRLPGVVRLLDDGMEGPRYFLVMELLDGQPFPGQRGALPWSELAPLALALIETLARVHLAGVVHRDIKPQNVLVLPGGRPVVLDFGLAIGDAVSPARSAGGLTVAYAAPEQLEGRPCDARTDLYALGVMLFEALSGTQPHGAGSATALRARRLRRPAPSIARLARELPEEVSRAIDALLCIDPDERPSSALELLDRLGGHSRTLISHPVLDRLPSDRDIDEIELRGLFAGPDLFTHLGEDGAAALWTRTGGQPQRVAHEIGAWVRAGLAWWDDGGLVIERTAIERLAGGLPVAPVAPDEGRYLSEGARQALAQIRRRFPDAHAEESSQILHELRAAGLIWHLPGGRLGAQPLIGAAGCTSPGAPLDQTLPVQVERAERLIREGRLQQAASLIDLGLSSIRVATPEAESLLDLEAELLRLLCLTSLAGESISSFNQALYAMGRAVGWCDDLDAWNWLLLGARAAYDRDADRALQLLDALPPLPDEELECWRQAARVRAFSARGLAEETRALDELEPWARGVPTRVARLAGWRGTRAYRQGHAAEAAALHRQSVIGVTRPDARQARLLNAAFSALECHEYAFATATAQEVQESAAALRHPMNEALATYVLEQVRYRLGQRSAPRPALVAAAAPVGRYPEALLAITEAAVAWRRGDAGIALELARLAARNFTAFRQEAGRRLAVALALCARGAASDEELAPLAEPYDGEPPGLVIQTLGLMSLACKKPDPAWRARALQLAQRLPSAQHQHRLEVLSVDEALGLQKP